jgi:hypothetical protein
MTVPFSSRVMERTRDVSRTPRFAAYVGGVMKSEAVKDLRWREPSRVLRGDELVSAMLYQGFNLGSTIRHGRTRTVTEPECAEPHAGFPGGAWRS